MNLLCWNCRGAGKAATIRELRDLAKQFAPTVLCIVETQIERTRVESLAGTIGYDNGYAVSSQGRSGGLGFFWNNPIKIEILGYSVYHIDCSVEEPGSDPWRMTLFYGEAQTHLRYQAWDVLKGISTFSNLPWICIGDFNEVLDASEQFGGNVWEEWKMDGFREAVDDCRLDDLGNIGLPYTWDNRQQGMNNVKVRLDRGLCDEKFQESFDNTSVLHV